MPTPLLKKIASDSNISLAKVEKTWDEAKKIVVDGYDYSITDDRYWALVTSITKKMLKIDEAIPVALEAQVSFAYILHQLIEENVLEEGLMISEASSGLTYYEMRSFLALLLKNTRQNDTKNVLDDLLKTLGKLEMMNKPVPVIRKIKSVSPSIF